MNTQFKVGDVVRLKPGYHSYAVANELEGDLKISSIQHDTVYFVRRTHTAALWRLEPVCANRPPQIDPALPYTTRDGRKVLRILCTDAPGPYPVVALVENGSSSCPYQYASSGCFQGVGGHPLDLVPVPKRVCGWINIYETYCSQLWETREEADWAMSDSPKRRACIYINAQEGDGL